MNASTHNHASSAESVAVRVLDALEDLDEQERAARRMPHARPTDAAGRSARLALLAAQEAGWWTVLLADRHAHARYEVGWIYCRAAVEARTSARDRARFWRDSAARWRAVADYVATSSCTEAER